MFSFDLSDYDNDLPLPAGKYEAQVEISELRSGAKLGVSYLLIVLVIRHDGLDYRVYDRLITEHPKENVRSIGRNKISRLSKALGLKNPQSPSDFVSRYCIANIEVEDQSANGYSDQNKVKWYEEIKV